MIICGEQNDLLARAIVEADWNFSDADTGYLTHAVHRYSGKFIPQVAGQAIELLTRPGDFVVDPYCGSGTTLLEAALHGRKAMGIDLNPLALLIAVVKITPIAPNVLDQLGKRAERVVDCLESDGLFREPPLKRDQDDPRLADPWYIKWFQPAVLRDLVALHNAIMDQVDPRTRNIGLLAFSNILRRVSNAHQGYPNVMFDKRGGERPRPGRLFLKSLKQIISAVSSLPSDKHWNNIQVQHGDARRLELEDDVAHAVITHPPYVGSIPYAEYGALSLKWLGYDPKVLDRQLTGGQRQSKGVLSRFTADYEAMIIEAHRVTRDEGYLCVLVGNPTIKGDIVDLVGMTLDHAERAGYERVAAIGRFAENRRANKMGDETLLTFQKV